MSDPYEKTICDVKAVSSPRAEFKAEQAIILTVIAGSDTDFGKHFVLERKRTAIGREKVNDIVLNDGKVSKAHCEVSVIRSQSGVEQINILDLDSTNGTFVNGDPVVQTVLKAGDKIQAGGTILQLSYSDEIEREYHAKLFDFAAHDALTGLYNKRYVLNEAENHFRIARRSGRTFSMIMIDIDDFKRINDRHGHLAGDEYLAGMAGVLARSLREQDIAGRVGGEEFLVILPETGLEGAFQLAERIRKNTEGFVLYRQDAGIRATISCGVCQYDQTFAAAQEFVDAVDQALYEAKNSGKNMVRQALLSGLENEGQ